MSDIEFNPSEVSVKDLIETINNYKFVILGIGLITSILVGFLSLTIPNEYATKTDLLINSNQGNSVLGSLGGLAGLAGVSLPEGESNGINPEIYPDIVKSTPFMYSLLDSMYYFEDVSKKITIEDYFEKYQKSSIVSKVASMPMGVLRLFKGGSQGDDIEEKNSSFLLRNEILALSEQEIKALEDFKNSINIEYDKNTSIVSLEVTSQNPSWSAFLAHLVTTKLKIELANFETQMESKKLKFIESQLEARRKQFIDTQKKLANFMESNQGSLNNLKKMELQNIESEYDLSFSLFQVLQQQYEDAKIKVEESMPVLTILEPVKIPLVKSSPNRFIITFISFVLSSLVSLGYFVWRKNRSNNKFQQLV